MNYIYQSQKVELYIDVYKGQSAVKEDFSRADLSVFLVHGVSRPLRIPLRDVQITNNGALKATAMHLPVGVYHLSLIWGKNAKMPMKAESETLFAVTEHSDEATNPNADLARIKVTMHTATYGYDGMSAYELSFSKGFTTLSEEEWLAVQNGMSKENQTDIQWNDNLGKLKVIRTINKALAKHSDVDTLAFYIDKDNRKGEMYIDGVPFGLNEDAERVSSDIKELQEANVRNNETLLNNSSDIGRMKSKQTILDNTLDEVIEEKDDMMTLIQEFRADLDGLCNTVNGVRNLALSAKKCKGAFPSPAALRNAVPNPLPGDFAYVKKSFYEDFADWDPKLYWGNDYIGDKEDDAESWADNTTSVNDKFFCAVYERQSRFFKIVKPTTLQHIADDDISELMSDGYVVEEPVTISEDPEDVRYYRYMANNNKWVNEYTYTSLDINESVYADNVYDNGNSQSRINLVNIANALTLNQNLRSIAGAIRTIAKKVNEIEQKALYIEDMEYEEMKGACVNFLAADGVDNHKSLDFSTMPIVLS